MKKVRRSAAARRPVAATSNEDGAAKSMADVSDAFDTVATIAVRRATDGPAAADTQREATPAARSNDMAGGGVHSNRGGKSSRCDW